jgi:hypothetical protein
MVRLIGRVRGKQEDRIKMKYRGYIKWPQMASRDGLYSQEFEF